MGVNTVLAGLGALTNLYGAHQNSRAARQRNAMDARMLAENMKRNDLLDIKQEENLLNQKEAKSKLAQNVIPLLQKIAEIESMQSQKTRKKMQPYFDDMELMMANPQAMQDKLYNMYINSPDFQQDTDALESEITKLKQKRFLNNKSRPVNEPLARARTKNYAEALRTFGDGYYRNTDRAMKALLDDANNEANEQTNPIRALIEAMKMQAAPDIEDYNAIQALIPNQRKNIYDLSDLNRAVNENAYKTKYEANNYITNAAKDSIGMFDTMYQRDNNDRMANKFLEYLGGVQNNTPYLRNHDIMKSLNNINSNFGQGF